LPKAGNRRDSTSSSELNKQNKIKKGYKQEYKPYLEYDDDETKKNVAKNYKKDIETFNYTFTD